jgi:membrane protein required for colicin V production
MASLPINAFDAAVYLCLIVAVVFGFTSGLLRSLATIFGYLAAAPITVALVPTIAPFLISQFQMSSARILAVAFAIFVVLGMVLSALLRRVVSMVVGPQASLPDRLCGAVLGAVRIGLLAVLLVLIFDRMIPPGRDPPFLADSRLRPILSKAGQAGLKSLPPEVEDFIDRLRRARRI